MDIDLKLERFTASWQREARI